MINSPCQRSIKKTTNMRGMALVTILLIIALGTTLISIGALKSSVAISRVENTRLHNQLYQYALMAEHWAVLALHTDSNGYDSYQEKWATGKPEIQVDDAIIKMRIDDEQSKFNINALSGSPVGGWRGYFYNLLRALEVKNPEQIHAIIFDYIDKDQIQIHGAGLSGAEERPYIDDELPYRPLDRQLVFIGEILAAKGIEKEDIEKLRPYLTAYPIPLNSFISNAIVTNNSDATQTSTIVLPGLPINILTCELPLFNLFSSSGFSESALSIIQKIRTNDLSNISKIKVDVLTELTRNGARIDSKRFDKMVTGSTKIFSVHTTVELGGQSMNMYSLLYRPTHFSGGRVSVIDRWSELN